ncbi:hypothetical protein L21SP2_2786 [Salinispira pacifica]|uniref:Uncharacterized protein n=1 Tax=Salinispira pacifica TaxID=1307761 RepID=V5WM08_9SPIO|nr:hypothetical protein L21SP2_2786 [Salinispira pacifica]
MLKSDKKCMNREPKRICRLKTGHVWGNHSCVRICVQGSSVPENCG